MEFTKLVPSVFYKDINVALKLFSETVLNLKLVTMK